MFTLAASWDFPADMSSYSQGDGSAISFGTEANFQANYRLTPAFLNAHKAPFLRNNRIWIGGYSLFRQDIWDYGTLLASDGIAHTTETPHLCATHLNIGGSIALAALYQESISCLPHRRLPDPVPRPRRTPSQVPSVATRPGSAARARASREASTAPSSAPAAA